jgi:hypothetical protein
MPGIGITEARLLAVTDQYGAVTSRHQLMFKWLSFYPEGPVGPDAGDIANERFIEFLEAKGVGVDHSQRCGICMGVVNQILARPSST